MPFPWKKNRVTRISQIVADLQSPKRGGSLVVETGFPTSLIDLFVKNRSRFRKHRSKKPVQPDISDPPPPPPSPVTSPPPMTGPLAPIVSHSDVQMPSSGIEGNIGEAAVPVRVGECGSGSGLNMVVAKILMVTVLVASVNRLTVGITVSAFALLFLEYAGNRVVSCPNVKSLSQKVSTCVWFQKLLRLKAKTGSVQVVRVELSSESLSIDEIEVVEAKSDVGICCELDLGCELENSSSKEKVLEPCPCEVSECKIRGSRSGRFKSKMVKKLVPKKFRSSKKETKEKGSKHNEAESGSEVSSVVEEDKLPIIEIEEVVEDDGKEEEENEDKTIKTKIECIRDDCGITCSHRKGNSSSIILVIIALVGLLAGRFQALVLSMTWCCMLKVVRSLWRSQNVALIKCSSPNS